MITTYREIIYIILDELKIASDDSTYTEDHILFLIDKYRAFLLKQRYSDIKKQIPDSNYQQICLDLEVVTTLSDACELGEYLKSTSKIPFLMTIGINKVTPIDIFKGEITLVSRERFKYVGYNKYLQNIIYATITPDHYLYIKSQNIQFKNLEKVKLVGIFSSAIEASKLSCDPPSENCNRLDIECPIESALIPPLVELIVKELSGAIYRPKDIVNNAADNFNTLSTK